MSDETFSEAMARLRADYERLSNESSWFGRFIIRRNLRYLDALQQKADARRDKTLEQFWKDTR